MKTLNSNITISEFRNNFPQRGLVKKGELRQIFHTNTSNLSDQGFRRILYSLVKEGRIIPIGAGLFGLKNISGTDHKSKFYPSISITAKNLSIELKENFPYSTHIIWETQSVREFMVNQPAQNLIVIETDKDITESYFYYLKQKSIRNVFINPDQKTFERYIVDLPESILILNTITQSPTIDTGDILSSKLEKILVDIFANQEHFFAFHGQELVNIFENAFSTYWINTKTLFRYAGRRNVDNKIKNFINHQTQINLSEYAVEN